MGAPPVYFSRAKFEELLPDEDSVNFIQKYCLVAGKSICAKFFGLDNPDLGAVLSMEAGLSSWHQTPVTGAVSEWPWVLKEVLEHARGVSVILEQSRNAKIEKDMSGDK